MIAFSAGEDEIHPAIQQIVGAVRQLEPRLQLADEPSHFERALAVDFTDKQPIPEAITA